MSIDIGSNPTIIRSNVINIHDMDELKSQHKKYVQLQVIQQT
jgi:hypothetical protein